MCGIVGIVGRRPVAPVLVEGLKRLEYRGYDSAGIATLVNGHIDRRRAEGKIVNLDKRLAAAPLPGTTGIGHTRWATHGVPSEANAHPHANAQVAVVHNGIIENYQELKAELTADGAVFESQTDTEVIVHLLSHYLAKGEAPVDCGAQRHRPAAWRLRARHHLRRRERPDDRRPARQPAWRSATATARCSSALTRWPWRL